MNIISYEKAYCLFPLATVESRRSLLSWSSQGRSTRRKEGLIKYRNRHFSMEQFLHSSEILPPIPKMPFILGPRWLGDPDTWVIKLNTERIPRPPAENPFSTAIIRDPVTISSFSMRYHPEDGAIMTFSVVESPTLKYSYVLGDEDLVDHLNRVLTFKEAESCRDFQAGLDSVV